MQATHRKQGSVLGGALLIAGSCIGVGMLALPMQTGQGGFFPSLFFFVIAAFFMTSTAIFLVEVIEHLGKRANLISMVSVTLGRWGRIACWVLYLFLFYALICAYITLSGNHTSLIVTLSTGKSLPGSLGSLLFFLLFSWMIFLGTQKVDYLNRLLMLGKGISLLLFIFVIIPYLNPQLLQQVDLKGALGSFPILVIAFGFHNIVPTLMSYMGGDGKRVKSAILIGSATALLIYLLWEIITLSILPVSIIKENYQAGFDITQSISTYLKKPQVVLGAQLLAFFAILTSFLAQGLSLVHFLSDGLRRDRMAQEGLDICLLALLPPLLFAFLFPSFFFQALDFAGGVCAVILFGIFPTLMVWLGPYRSKTARYPFLILILAIALLILIDQLTRMCGYGLLDSLATFILKR